MNTLKKTAAVTLLGGALLTGAGLGLAHATPSAPQAQAAGDGMVNVAVSTNGQTVGAIQDVSLAHAVSLATSVCPTSMIDLSALTKLDVNGIVPTNPCNGPTGLSFKFSQNTQGPITQSGNQGRAELAPGQNKNPVEGQPPSATPSTPPGQMGR